MLRNSEVRDNLYHYRFLPAVGVLAACQALTAWPMRPDPKYAPDKYFDEHYRSVAGAIWQRDMYFIRFDGKDL